MDENNASQTRSQNDLALTLRPLFCTSVGLRPSNIRLDDRLLHPCGLHAREDGRFETHFATFFERRRSSSVRPLFTDSPCAAARQRLSTKSSRSLIKSHALSEPSRACILTNAKLPWSFLPYNVNLIWPSSIDFSGRTSVCGRYGYGMTNRMPWSKVILLKPGGPISPRRRWPSGPEPCGWRPTSIPRF